MLAETKPKKTPKGREKRYSLAGCGRNQPQINQINLVAADDATLGQLRR